MNKKLMAVAVAGALAAPGLALAQSTVTISGFIKADVGSLSIGSANAVRAGLNTSTWAFEDGGPSRIRFTMREDLGGGLYGLGQLEIRPTINGRGTNTGNGVAANTVNLGFGSSSGNQWVGLETANMGTIRLGSIDQYYLEGGGYSAIYAPVDLTPQFLGYTNIAGAGDVQYGIGYQTRTRNVLHYDSPNFNGFTGQLGYNFGQGASGGSADLATGQRKVQGYYLSARYAASNWNVGFNYLIDKPSLGGAGATAVPAPIAAVGIQNGIGMVPAGSTIGTKVDARGERLFGEFAPGGGFTFQLGIDNTRLTASSGVAVTAPGVVGQSLIAQKTAWVLSGKYETGPHFVFATFGKAGNDSGAVGTINGPDNAKQWNVGYAYLFSKRTSVGIGYTKLTNSAGGYYSLANEEAAVTDNTGSGYNVNSSMARPGESESFIGMSMRHVF